MSGTTTPNYNFALPTISGDQNTWGNKLNSNWSSLDTLIHNLVVQAGGSGSTSLPLTGGTLTGPLTVNSSLNVAGTTTLGSTLTVNAPAAIHGNLTVSGAFETTTAGFGYPSITDFAIYTSGTQRILQYANNATVVYDTSQFTYYWNNTGTKMFLDGSGGLQIAGSANKPGGGPWNATSDDRMKRNVAPYTAGLEQVCQLKPIAYQYNGQGDTEADGKTYYGISAQQAQAVMPELVVQMTGPRRLPGQLGTQLGPLLLAACTAIRELRDRVVALEAGRA
jgi:hypothetical protein